MPENDISSIVNTNTRFIKDSHRRNVGLDKTNEFWTLQNVCISLGNSTKRIINRNRKFR